MLRDTDLFEVIQLYLDGLFFVTKKSSPPPFIVTPVYLMARKVIFLGNRVVCSLTISVNLNRRRHLT